MNRERILSTLEKGIHKSVATYINTVEKWISETETPRCLYDDLTSKVGVRIQIVDENTVKSLTFDMVKFDRKTGRILVHQLGEGQNSISSWIPAATLDGKAIDIYKCILWLDKEDLIVLDGDTHSGTANLVWSFSSKSLYFIHEEGHIVDIDWYDDGIDHFIGCNGEFAVHKYDWSIAMREIDEHEEDMEEDDYLCEV